MHLTHVGSASRACDQREFLGCNDIGFNEVLRSLLEAPSFHSSAKFRLAILANLISASTQTPIQESSIAVEQGIVEASGIAVSPSTFPSWLSFASSPKLPMMT